MCGRRALFLGQVQVWHAQFFFFGLDFAFVPDIGLRELVFEEAFVVIPRLFGWAFRKAREIVRIGDGLDAASLRSFGQQCKIQSLDWFAAFRGQLRADAPFVFQARNFVAAGAAKVANPLLAVVLQLGIIHEGSIRVGGRLLFFQSNQVTGDIFRILWREPQAGDDGHVLDWQFVPVVGAFAVVQIENISQALLLVILRADILLLVWTVWASTLAGVVDPADQVIVIVLFAYACEIGGEGSPLYLVAFTDGMTGEASTRFEQFFAMRGAAGLMLRQRIGERRLPQVSGDGFDLIIVEAEIGHLGGSAEAAGLLQPNGNPVLVQLQANVF